MDVLELQKIDCNCNDCVFMNRNTERFKQSLEFQKSMQENSFNIYVANLKRNANKWRIIFNDLEKWDLLMTEAEKMKFQFDKSGIKINYGFCTKFNKDVTFIPNICQLETQNCFKHRKDE